jgi:hypothetical protein
MIFEIRFNSQLLFYLIMGKRITIMLDDDLDKKLRLIQAKAIQNTARSVSFSTVLNKTLRNYLKK